MKGRFYLRNIENIVIFGVLEMDERFRGDKNNPNTITSCSTGISVASGLNRYPLVSHYNLHLRTERVYDNAFSCHDFETKKEAEIFIKKAKIALKKWAKMWGGWDESHPKKYDSKRYIFEF